MTTDGQTSVFAASLGHARDYRQRTLVGAIISQIRAGRFFESAMRAWRAFRPTFIIGRVLRWTVLLLTFIERSAVLFTATAVTLALLPLILLLLMAVSAVSVRACRRAYAQIRNHSNEAVVLFGSEGQSREAWLDRASALADGRAAVLILPGSPIGAVRDSNTRVTVGGGMLFFYLKKRAERDGIRLWVIY